jgi:hypothetical protein
MAPLPPNNTPTYFLDYTTSLQEHTMEVRAAASVSPATFSSIMDSFLTQLASELSQITIVGGRFRAAGTTFSSPVVLTITGNSYGVGGQTQDSLPIALNFVGRSPGGRRVRLMVFGYKGTFSAYRVNTSESTAVTNAVSTLNNTVNCFQAIDGLDPVWYPYANVLVNAYWQRKTRAG